MLGAHSFLVRKTVQYPPSHFAGTVHPGIVSAGRRPKGGTRSISGKFIWK